MIEGKRSALSAAFDLRFCQNFILFKEHRQIFLGQRIGVFGSTHNGLHGKLIKAQIKHVENVVGKIGVVVGVRTAQVVALALALFYKVPELGYDGRVAALAVDRFAQSIVHLFSAVQGKYDVVALAVCPLDDLVIDKHAVGGQRKAEILVMLLLDAACVCHDLLDHVKVH